MQKYNKILSLLISAALLLGLPTAAMAAPGQAQEPAAENLTVDFSGTNGPDNLDEMYPRPTAKSAKSATANTTAFTDVKNIVILVNFSGLDEFITPARFQTLNSIYNTNTNSLKGYISHITYGGIQVDSAFYPKAADGTVVSYVDQHPIEYYKTYSTSNPLGYKNNAERFEREAELLSGAFQFVKEQIEADFTGEQLDNNNDGRIDSIAFLMNGYRGTGGGIAWNDLLWPHKYSSSGFYLNGKNINNYNFLLADIPPAGSTAADTGLMPENAANAKHTVVIHEFLHTFGLPDLYHYNTGGTPVGQWDIMGYTASSPQNMLQYMQREYQGWGTPIHEITASGSQTLQYAKYEDAQEDGGYGSAPESALILRSPYSDTEFFVVEYRKKTGYDSNLPGEGLIIYRVNTEVTSRSNAGGPPDYLYVFRPNESSINPGSYATNAFFSAQSKRTSIGKAIGQENSGFDNQTLYYSDGTNSGIVISQISSAGGDTMTFQVSIPPATIEGTGTAANPYQIFHPSHLKLLSQYPDKYFKLIADIDCSNMKSGDFTSAVHFTGNLNGNNHTISNLTHYDFTASQNGFLSSIGTEGNVYDLTLENCTIVGTDNVGVLAGTIEGTVQRVKIIGGAARSLTDSNDFATYAGGICGTALSPANITGCTASATITGKNAGGLAGLNHGAVWSHCYADCNVDSYFPNSKLAAVFGKQIVDNTYIPGNHLYWNTKLGLLDGANIVRTDESPYIGNEGLIGVHILNNTTVQAGKNSAQLLQFSPASAVINGTWSSSDTSIATVSDGIVTGVSAGTAVITLTIPLYGQVNLQLTSTITVTAE